MKIKFTTLLLYSFIAALYLTISFQIMLFLNFNVSTFAGITAFIFWLCLTTVFIIEWMDKTDLL